MLHVSGKWFTICVKAITKSPEFKLEQQVLTDTKVRLG